MCQWTLSNQQLLAEKAVWQGPSHATTHACTSCTHTARLSAHTCLRKREVSWGQGDREVGCAQHTCTSAKYPPACSASASDLPTVPRMAAAQAAVRETSPRTHLSRTAALHKSATLQTTTLCAATTRRIKMCRQHATTAKSPTGSPVWRIEACMPTGAEGSLQARKPAANCPQSPTRSHRDKWAGHGKQEHDSQRAAHTTKAEMVS